MTFTISIKEGHFNHTNKFLYINLTCCNSSHKERKLTCNKVFMLDLNITYVKSVALKLFEKRSHTKVSELEKMDLIDILLSHHHMSLHFHAHI